MTNRHLALVLLLTVVVGVVPSSTSGQSNFKWGVSTPVEVHNSARELWSCTPTTKVWSQEIGESGITRLRARFELRGPFDTGLLPTWWESEWLRSAQFPNDTLNYSERFTLAFDGVTVGNGKQLAVWTVLIGEKPSFWARDAKIKQSVDTFICEFVEA